MSDKTLKRLQAYYQDQIKDKQDAKIRNMVDISSGWESEMYTFELQHGSPSARIREELVLRIYAGEDAVEKAKHEFHSIKNLHKYGFPVPQVYLLESERSPFDNKPFGIMERIKGYDMWARIDTASEEETPELVSQFCQLFVQLHRLDWRPFAADADEAQFEEPYAFFDQWLNLAQIGTSRRPQIGFQSAVEWFRDHREQFRCNKPSLTHNDFHPNNVLLQPDGRPVVIDWTGFQISDARFDLAWTLVLIDSYMGAAWRERILKGYQQHAGGEIEALEYFEAFACARRLFDISSLLILGGETLGMRPEAVTQIAKTKAAHQRVYQRFVKLADLRIQEIEKLFS